MFINNVICHPCRTITEIACRFAAVFRQDMLRPPKLIAFSGQHERFCVVAQYFASPLRFRQCNSFSIQRRNFAGTMSLLRLCLSVAYNHGHGFFLGYQSSGWLNRKKTRSPPRCSNYHKAACRALGIFMLYQQAFTICSVTS